jgi:hypothetical protein
MAKEQIEDNRQLEVAPIAISVVNWLLPRDVLFLSVLIRR